MVIKAIVVVIKMIVVVIKVVVRMTVGMRVHLQ